MHKDSKIYVAGHRGMVGSAIFRRLAKDGYNNIITRTSTELDLRNQAAVNAFFDAEKPEYVFIAAAKVGGILANNTYRADFVYDNLMIEANIIHASFVNKTKKLLFLGSSCIYPRLAPQPMKEDHLLSGYLEQTNQPYAISKIAGIEMCDSYRAQHGCNFISAMPTNLFGPNDNYDLHGSHVLPALLRKFIMARRNNTPEVVIWGTGLPRREFLHVDDLADACLFLMLNYNEKGLVNIGTGTDVTIAEVAQIIKKITGYMGNVVFDTTKPDGAPRKLLDVSKLTNLGWKVSSDFEERITSVYEEIKNVTWD